MTRRWSAEPSELHADADKRLRLRDFRKAVILTVEFRPDEAEIGPEADMTVLVCEVGFTPKSRMSSCVEHVRVGRIADTTVDLESSKSGKGDLEHLREMTLRSA